MRRGILLFCITLADLFVAAAVPAQVQIFNTCEAAYGASQPQNPPKWLQSQVTIADLATQNRYDVLAGRLLQTGLTNGSQCSSNGINRDGSANACGLEAARSSVAAWQNRYDPAILSAAQAYGLPPYLMKAVIAVESQFWPGPDWVKGEIGLGQMTQGGADLLLTYRPVYYQGICRQALGDETCNQDYLSQPFYNRAMLRGLVLQSLDTTCSSCQGGIDVDKGTQAVTVLAESLVASCSQSARVITTATGKRPSELMPYEDFWRFVLANYHSGAGCMLQALQQSGDLTSWSGITAGLSSGCISAPAYIHRIEESIKP